MAGKPLNRLDLRRQREAAEPLDPMEDETDEVVEEVDEEEVSRKEAEEKAESACQVESEVAPGGQAGRTNAHRVGRIERCIQTRRHV